eukprot:4352070-Lingulodinium_polyedra.AAC.1
MQELDLLQSPGDDLLDPDVVTPIMKELETGQWDFLIASPPCNTFSRACWANCAGPRPVRSRAHPLGFPWLEGRAREKAEQGNKLLEVTLEAILAAHRGGA